MNENVGQLPLTGVRVIDLTTSYAGPTATMYLGDMGAEVIKVERPDGGDDARAWGPPFIGDDSAWFLAANRNKRSICLDLFSAGGREVLDKLLGSADVLVASFNPAKLERLGIGTELIRSRYPRLIYCVLSGFGLDGPELERPGYDLISQARGGLMSVTGAAGGEPQRVSTALSDIVAGTNAAFAVSCALRRQAISGEGELIDVSLLDGVLALMSPRIAAFVAGDEEPRPSGATDSVLAIYQSFRTATRRIVLAVGNDTMWRRLCDAIELDGLADDGRLQSNAGRRANRTELVEALSERLMEEPADVWLSRLRAHDIPCAPVQFLSDVIADPQVLARQSILRLGNGDEASWSIPAVESPWRLRYTDGSHEAPPALGAHGREILSELGYGPEEAESLLTNAMASGTAPNAEIPNHTSKGS